MKTNFTCSEHILNVSSRKDKAKKDMILKAEFCSLCTETIFFFLLFFERTRLTNTFFLLILFKNSAYNCK